jgi:hypothetical protein
MKLRSATQTFASLAAAGADPTSAEAIADSCRGARLALTPFVSGGFAAAVVSVSKPASGRAAVDWEDLSCGDAARVPDADALALATKVANDQMKAMVPTLPSNTGVKFDVTPSVSAGTSGYRVAVTAQGRVKSTLMGFLVDGVSATAAAAAENPMLTAKIGPRNLNFDAADLNELYWYTVPTKCCPSPALQFIASDGKTDNPTEITVRTPASAKIGFALKNTTGGRASYLGSNQYCGAQQSVHVFRSHLTPPSAEASPTVTTN